MYTWKTCKPLSDSQLSETVALAQAGDNEALARLTASMIKLASKIANQYRNFAGSNTDDLTSEALIGVLQAIQSFDPTRGTKFTTHAAWAMRERILKYVVRDFSLVKIGTTQAQKKIFWRLNRETRALRNEGITVTDQALAERLHVKASEIQSVRERMQGESSLDATDPDTGRTLLESTPGSVPSPERYATERRMTAWVQTRMIEFEQRLADKDLAVWNLRIASEEPLTAQIVGDRLGVSKQYVCQTEKRLTKAFTKYARNR